MGPIAQESDNPLPLRKLKTCFRFPLDGRAFVENLHINTSRLRISSLVICASLNDFPLSKDPSSLNSEIRIARQTQTLISSPSQQQTRRDFPWIKFDLANLTAKGRLLSNENRSNFEPTVGMCKYAYEGSTESNSLLQFNIQSTLGEVAALHLSNLAKKLQNRLSWRDLRQV